MKRDSIDLKIVCSLGMPYPKIEVIEENPYYANLIKKVYTGMVSELTEVTEYTYQQFIVSDKIKNVLSEIAKVEMIHLKILGELLVALGENPTFSLRKKNKNLYWSSEFINKNTLIKEILLQDINREKEIIKQYREACNLIENENIITILTRIILDEELHIKLLEGLYTQEIDNNKLNFLFN